MTVPEPLGPEALYTPCDPTVFDFETTEGIREMTRMIGQDRAQLAAEISADIELQGYNLFVFGSQGTGRHSFIQQFLHQKAADRPVPSDWCYVNNFDEPRNPVALEFPPGRARQFRKDMEQLIAEVGAAIPAAFESEDYHKRREAIESRIRDEQQKAFEEVRQHAEEQGLGIVQTVTGFTFVPLRDGEAISPEEYEKLSDEERERLQKSGEKLSKELDKMMRALPPRVRRVRNEIRQLEREMALFAVGGALDELISEYSDLPKVVEYLKRVREDIADNVQLFTQEEEKEAAVLGRLLGGGDALGQYHESGVKRRYRVNVIVDRTDEKGAPVIFEGHPTYSYLLGQIEHVSQMGTLTTDFSLIRAGALHRANGGYLVLDVLKVLTHPFAWEGLKRALISRKLETKTLEQIYSLVSTVSLEPEPIPLDLKVVLVGSRELFYLLDEFDPEFPDLFKISAEFDDEMKRDDENIQRHARLLGTIARKESLKPLHREAVARIIEESSRHAGDAEMLTGRVRRINDILREAHYWAGKNGNRSIMRADVQRAIEAQDYRGGRVRDWIQREILRGTILIDTDGEMAGQINGLSLIQIGESMFGRPIRITARYSMGSGKVVDIEREVELGGPIHSKGVLILSNFLAAHYVTDRPLSLSASLVFEQSYGGVEGDSASLAELCALLSALSGVSIGQSFAVTGSVNQNGRVQAIGGVNQKIEGFFEICKARGLTGDQAVIIPESNVKHLMLHQNVLDAVKEKKFAVYAVSNVDECMELLTGIEAGARDPEGRFPDESINGRITRCLVDLAEKRKRFAAEARRDGK